MYYVYQPDKKGKGAGPKKGRQDFHRRSFQEGGAVPARKGGHEGRHPARAYCVPAARESHLTIHSWMNRSLPLVSTTSIMLSSSLWRMNASPTPFPSIK